MRYYVEVRKIPHKDRGVFALKNFKKGEIIETCPVVRLSERERKHCEKTILANYIYPWRTLKDAVMVLGYGSIYNHSYTPNAHWHRRIGGETMVYKAVGPIEKGEEITVNYNEAPTDKAPIDWFRVRK